MVGLRKAPVRYRLVKSAVPAGWQADAQDYFLGGIDLNECLIDDPGRRKEGGDHTHIAPQPGGAEGQCAWLLHGMLTQ